MTDGKRIPIYKKIYFDLKESILNGDFQGDNSLISERLLKEKYKVSHLTVRNALSLLVKENLIRREPGVGTIVIWTGAGSKQRKLRSISVILEQADDYFSKILNLCAEACSRQNLQLHFYSHKSDMAKCQRQYESAQKEDDTLLIVMPPGPACQWLNFHPALSRTIIVDETIPGLECPQIMSDDRQGMFRLVKYLVGLGHRKIAHIGAESKSSGMLRRQGYLDALKSCNIEYIPALTGNGAFSSELSYNAFRHVMQNNKNVTACVCANDYSAFGVMKYLHNHKLTVGKDFALAGYGNYDISVYLDLTSVDQKVDLIVKQIFCLIEQYESSGTMPSGNFVIPTELKIRESCCALKNIN